MSRNMNSGKSNQILLFVRQFVAAHGFSPTIREIGEAVGLSSTSTVYGYLNRMTKRGLISSEPGKPRSLHVPESRLEDVPCTDGSAVLNCKFQFPQGARLVSVIAMVADDAKQHTPITAEHVEILHMAPAEAEKIGV